MSTIIKDASQIRSRHVRLVLPDGPIIIDKTEALAKAAADELDMVMVQDGDLPVVKLVNFAKLEYEKQKNVGGNHAKKPKQVQIGPHTQEHDLKRFAAKAEEFIKEGHPVSVRMDVRGRDRSFRDLLRQRMSAFVVMVPSAKPGRLSVSDDGSAYTQGLT